MEPQELDEALCRQLNIVNNSQSLMRTVILSLAMQYRALDLQKCQILGAAAGETVECCPDPKAMQIGASLILLSALFGFQKQAEQLACEAAQTGACPDETDVKLGAIIILAALIRLVRLVQPPLPPAASSEAAPRLTQAEDNIAETPVQEEAQAEQEEGFLDEPAFF